MNDFKLERNHYGELKIDAEEHGFNTIVIAAFAPCEDIKKVGRLLQVRKNAGAFGTDSIFIRTMDGGIECWENQSFYSVHPDCADYFHKLFEETPIDPPNSEYSINQKHKASGFIVKGMDCTDSKVHSFSMVITVQ